MSSTLRAATDGVVAELESAGVDVPSGWQGSIEAALRPIRFDELTIDRSDDFIAAHFAFMNSALDDVTTIVFLQAAADAFAANSRELKLACERAGKSSFMTRIVLNRRLASRYFHEGRRRVNEPSTASSGSWLLKRCLRVTTAIVYIDDRASPRARQTMHSQIASACAHLARTLAREDPERETLLRDGLTHSMEADRHGDHSADHDGYSLELAIRLHELTGESTLELVQDAIDRTHDARSATLQGLQGDVRFAQAMVTRHERDTSRFLPNLLAAVDHYDLAIALPRDERSADIGYHLAKRGRSHALLYEQAADEAGRRDTLQLDRALADWLDPRSRPHRQDHEVARLLLARARLATARSETPAAHADLSGAARLLAGQDAPGPTGRLEAQDLDVAMNEAMDRDDPSAALVALTAAASLPPGAPAPAGAMTGAALWLLGRMSRPEWEQLAQSVLDRVEADAAHPALTPSARGHVTGHAATLARSLYLTDTADASAVRRAVELSRIHVDASTDLSAAALDGASRAAFVYASMTAASADAPSEDDLGHWVDTLMWGLSALQTQQRIRTTAPARLDVADCAVRVSDAALWLRRATGDNSFIEDAFAAVGIAEDLAPDTRLSAARARLSPSVRATRTGAQPRRVIRPAGAPTVKLSPDLDSAHRTHVAWRTLADAELAAGDEAVRLRQLAALQFCELTASDHENLGGKRRGGQRGVTIAHDPHGLARRLVVLKRVEPETARREFDALVRLSGWLSARQDHPGWSVPEPLGVVDVADDAVLVMRRLPGHTMAHHAMEHFDGRRAVAPLAMLDPAVAALGEFHTAMLSGPAVPREDVIRTLCDATAYLTTPDMKEAVTAALAPLVSTAAYLSKKDAHAGNWIWSTVSGGLVMLDVEGATTRPVILELATLLDDLPFIGLDRDGWSMRLALARRYVDSLPTLHRPKDDELQSRLEASMLYVAVTGLARLNRRSWGTSSLGVRLARKQHDHYLDLIDYLSDTGVSIDVRRAAATVRSSRRIGRLGARLDLRGVVM